MGTVKQKLKVILAIVILTIALYGCSTELNSNNENLTIKDISYNKNKLEDKFTVYIKENDNLEPYLVIDNNYNGDVLLLRKYLLDLVTEFNFGTSFGSRSSYYPDSIIDKYLNSSYLSMLDDDIKEKIINTEIEVSTLESLDSGGGKRETEKITRQAFILSATELDIKSNMSNKEGKKLQYFKDSSSKDRMKYLIATYKSGEAEAYWLRSSYLWDDHQSWVVGADGMIGGSLVSFEYSIRPAISISAGALISKQSFKDKDIYVIAK